MKKETKLIPELSGMENSQLEILQLELISLYTNTLVNYANSSEWLSLMNATSAQRKQYLTLLTRLIRDTDLALAELFVEKTRRNFSCSQPLDKLYLQYLKTYSSPKVGLSRFQSEFLNQTPSSTGTELSKDSLIEDEETPHKKPVCFKKKPSLMTRYAKR